MKKIYSFFTMLVVALMGLSLTACSNDDLSTDQYGSDISLTAFGPCPVVRGGTLHLYGANLDQLASINLPGAEPITAFEVIKAGAQSEITIQVPAENCEPGQITLVTKKGGTIVSVSPITYREDFIFTTMYIKEADNLSGAVGDVLTIKGDYMNLIKAVVFTDKAIVEAQDFVSQDRYTIEVAIPVEAKSGTIMLTDLAEEALEYETEEAITVKLPVYESCEVAKWKAGETVTFKGVDLNQIEQIVFPGAPIDEFTVSEDGKTITCKMPAESASGTIQLVTYSGVSIPAATVETVKPSNLAVDPSPVKNLGKLTISGTDLDLVSAISLPNSGALAADKWSYASDKITITEIPETAQEGDITLSMKGGESVAVAYKLIWPTITGSTPAAVKSKDQLTITGTDLDLVSSITLPSLTTPRPEVKRADFKEADETHIVLEVPTAAEGTDITLNLKNNTIVKGTGTVNILAVPFITGGATSGGRGLTAKITGVNFNKLRNLYVGSELIKQFASKTDTEITFAVPAIALGVYKMKFEDYEGNMYDGPDFEVTAPLIELWTGKLGPTNWSGDKTIPLTDAIKAELIPGRMMRIVFECDAAGGQMEICGSWWTQLQGPKDAWVALGKSLNGEGRAIMDFGADETTFDFPLLQADIDILKNQGAILFVGNGGLTVTGWYVYE